MPSLKSDHMQGNHSSVAILIEHTRDYKSTDHRNFLAHLYLLSYVVIAMYLKK